MRTAAMTDHLSAGQVRVAWWLCGRRGAARLALRNWRLVAVIASAAVIVAACGGSSAGDPNSTAASLQRVATLASLTTAVTKLVWAMEDEQDDIAQYVASGRPGTMDSLLFAQGQESVTNLNASHVTAAARGIGSRYPSQVRAAVTAMLSRMAEIGVLRQAATSTHSPAMDVITSYSQDDSTFVALDDQVAASTSDRTLARDLRALCLLSQAEDMAAQQRAILDAALITRQFQVGERPALSSAVAQEHSDLTQFGGEATAAQQKSYASLVAGQDVDGAAQMLSQAMSGGQNGRLAVTNPPGSAFRTVQQSWTLDMQFTLDQMRTAQQGLMNQITTRSRVLLTQTTGATLAERPARASAA